jgi:hypothetical protein
LNPIERLLFNLKDFAVIFSCDLGGNLLEEPENILARASIEEKKTNALTPRLPKP